MATFGKSSKIKLNGLIYEPAESIFDNQTLIGSKTIDNKVSLGGFSLKEGTNITLTPDTSTSVLTIDAAGGGGGGEFTTATLPDRIIPNLATHSFVIGSTSLEGGDTKMFFDKAKGSFRAGTSGIAWNDGVRGINSVAFGNLTIASGENSAAMGEFSTASGENSFSFGKSCNSQAFNSVAGGNTSNANVSAINSFAFGNSCTTNGVNSVAMGQTCVSSGNTSISVGNSCTTNGVNSVSMGNGCVTNGDHCVSMGNLCTSSGENSISLGKSCTTSGDYSVSIGQGNSSTGLNSVALGKDSTAGHDNSFVYGYGGVPTASTSINQFIVRAKGIPGIGNLAAKFYTGDISSGPFLNNLDTDWQSSCDRNLKENLIEVDTSDFLDRVKRLPIFQYNYIGTDSANIRWGPTAQDWHELFPSEGNSKLSIGTQDPMGITLAAVKGLITENEILRERVTELESKQLLFEERLSTLESN